ATWCLTMSNSLKSPSNDIKWITVAYENLYSNFEEEINRIFSRLGIEVPPNIYKKKRVVSQTTIKSSEKHLKSGNQLTSWKNQLSKKQQDNIMGIVREFGLDCYDLNPEPYLEKLYVQ